VSHDSISKGFKIFLKSHIIECGLRRQFFQGNAFMLFNIAPTFLSAICVTLYWVIVMIKVVIITPKIGKMPNVIPKEWLGALSRLIMVPLILIWNYLMWATAFSQQMAPSSLLAWLGVIVIFIALTLSCYCWYYMGQAWRIGIDPNEKTSLITEGPFKYVRHPIYALAMLLMLGCFLTTQTISMLILLIFHWTLFSLEAHREEIYLRKIHKSQYIEYTKNSHPFFPCKKLGEKN
jgi:protein-S-isoprenylcysteine O-methyltransferase Ste14